MIQTVLQWWHQLSWLEITGVITGLLCVYLAAINNVWNWPIAIVSTVIYIYLFAKTALYADMLQYIYLTVINAYGWYFWSRKKNSGRKIPIVHITRKQLTTAIIMVLLITPALGYTLITFAARLHYQPPAYPYLDSFCTVCSLAAQVLLARKVLENWLIWIFVDVIYVCVYMLKGLQITSFMFAIYIIIAIVGYVDWRKEVSGRT